MPWLPLGGIAGLVIGRWLSGNKTTEALVLSFILCWVLFLIGVFVSDSVLMWHGLSFVGGIVPFWLIGKE
jgi:4-amino-4-deoxy-L-arabinose transferase-like glycosyltransferase